MGESTNHADTFGRHGDPDPTKWDEAEAVTGRERGPAPDNSTFNSRSKMVRRSENKAVTAAENKATAGSDPTADDTTCPECGFVAKTPAGLVSHQRTHQDD